MPLAVGNQWVYTYEQSGVAKNGRATSQRTEMIWKVVKAQPANGGVRATIEVSDGQGIMDRQEWESNPKGIFQVSSSLKRVPYSPPQPVIKFPVKEGSKHEWKGSGTLPINVFGTQNARSTVVGPQEVDTESGRVSAIAIETKSTFNASGKPGSTHSYAWFKPGVGLVRFTSRLAFGTTIASTSLKLKSSTIKQS